MSNHAAWQSVDLSAPGAVEGICGALERSPIAQRATLFHDPRWIRALAEEEGRGVRVYVLPGDEGLAGFVTFLVHPSSLRLALGELTLFRRPVSRLYAFAAPLVAAGGDRRREMSMLADLFERIGRELGEDEVIYLEAVQHETPLFDLLDGAARPAGFHAVQYGNFYRHRFAAIPGSYEAYLAQLGGRTRADLRTNRKRFVASVGQSYRTRRFCAPEEVPAFLPDAMDLSRKTYQYQLLGGGLRERATLEHRYLAAARLGWFRSYLLYVNDQPVAFQVGYVYRGRFLAAEIGYDPQWARHHVGIFLHTEIIADLAVDEAITEFDFDNDDGVHKERLSTRSTLEGYFYLIPARGMGGVMALSMRLTNRVSAALGTVLGRLGIRAKVRALLRKAGVAK